MSIVNYRVTVKNDGNGEDIFALSTLNMPDTWNAAFFSAQGEPITEVSLKAAEKRDVELRVHIPEGTSTTAPVEFQARATSAGAETDDVKLILEVRLPDLKIQSITYNPNRPKALVPVQITVRIQNDGTFGAENVVVIMRDGNREVGRELIAYVTKDSNATASFTWVPTAGKKTLTYDIRNDIPELSMENNQVVNSRTVTGKSEFPGFSSGAMLVALAAVAIALAARRFRD